MDLPECRVGPPQRNRRARARARKKIFTSHQFAFARGRRRAARAGARARTRAFFPRCRFPVFRASDATEAWASIPKPNQIELTHHAKPQKPNANDTESLSAELALLHFSRHRPLRSAAHARIHPRKRKKPPFRRPFAMLAGCDGANERRRKPLSFFGCAPDWIEMRCRRGRRKGEKGSAPRRKRSRAGAGRAAPRARGAGGGSAAAIGGPPSGPPISLFLI